MSLVRIVYEGTIFEDREMARVPIKGEIIHLDEVNFRIGYVEKVIWRMDGLASIVVVDNCPK